MARKLLFLDHYDSFSGNLRAFFEAKGFQIETWMMAANAPTFRRELSVWDACAGVILSPGPGAPAEYEATKELIRQMPESLPVFGVCLGHQILWEMSGALVRRQPGRCPHGRVQAIEARESSRLLGTKIMGSFVLFNSLAVDARTRLPEKPWVILSTGEGSVMASEHRLLPRLSVQFHPESFASRDGEALLDLVSTRLFAV